jgi:hypothetical protein
MKVRDLVLLLAGFNPDADVILWNWFALPGTGAEFHLHPTLNQDKAGGVLRLSAEGGRVPGTGPQQEMYLRVENSNDEIVGWEYMTLEAAEIANSWINYYGDRFTTPAQWEKDTGRELPEEYE